MGVPDPSARLVAVIDDEEMILRALSRVLRLAGFEVKTFLSVDSFLAEPAGSPWAAVLLDLHMPGVRGHEVLEMLQGGMRLPVITMSGEPGADRRLARGAIAHLAKPIDEDVLVAALQQAFSA
ncbi:response regulator [Ramlibacter sp. G-1-2-2]|uniref:Response regulator n=1 Tax=Ramlibacter agri TaxID=2728837 RepID=A0A848H0M4_9BURK|nr:response regulator [Ramlibacter agri]NML44516.1 response regulator [Ramlibacter agri]